MVNTDWEVVCPVSFSHKGLPERIIEAMEQPLARAFVPGRDPWATTPWWNRVTVLKADLSCPIGDTTRERFGPIDYVINYASDSHVDRSIVEPAPFIRNNIDIVLNLLEYVRVVRPEIFLQISTDEVYGPAPQGYAHREWDASLPSNPYAASKAAQEAVAVSYWRTYGVPVIVTNCMNLIGETQDPEKFVPMIISRVLAGETVPVHASAGGVIGSRFYLHARNMADAVLFLLNRGQVSMYADGADRPDKWHIVGEREVDNLEMAELVAKSLGRELSFKLVDFHSSRPGHDLRYALDGTKIAEAGWKMTVPFEESLRTLIDWTLAHPLWLRRHADG